MNFRLLIALVVVAAIALAVAGWTLEAARWLLSRGRSAARLRLASA
jgi:hypothetical protein